MAAMTMLIKSTAAPAGGGCVSRAVGSSDKKGGQKNYEDGTC